MTRVMRWFGFAATVLVAPALGVACRSVSGSDRPQTNGTQNAAGAGSKCNVSIAAWALEGCRAPNDPGCEMCWISNPDGACSILSGRARAGELWVYTSGSRETDCPAAGPRCAHCMRNSEASLCQPERRECNCQLDPGIDPCFAPGSCACYCSIRDEARKACPSPG